MFHIVVICFYLLLLPATFGSYPKCREGEKEGFCLYYWWFSICCNALQGKVCVPEVECEVEGCKEGGTVCRSFLKPRSLHVIRLGLVWFPTLGNQSGGQNCWEFNWWKLWTDAATRGDESAVWDGLEEDLRLSVAGFHIGDRFHIGDSRLMYIWNGTLGHHCFSISIVRYCPIRKTCSNVPVTSCQPCKCSTVYYCTTCPPAIAPPPPPSPTPSPTTPTHFTTTTKVPPSAGLLRAFSNNIWTNLSSLIPYPGPPAPPPPGFNIIRPPPPPLVKFLTSWFFFYPPYSTLLVFVQNANSSGPTSCCSRSKQHWNPLRRPA